MNPTTSGESEFLIPDRLWLVAPAPADPSDFAAVVRTTLRMTYARPGRPPGSFVPAFTDTDLVYRFIARLGPRAAGMQGYSGRTPDESVTILERLREAGDTHLGLTVDPIV